MRKIVTLLITLSLGRAFLQAQDLLAPKIEEAPVYIDSAGIHMIGELSIEQREIIKSEVIRLIEDFNNNVAKLCHPWTAEEKKLFTLKEREEYKNRIECEVRALFRADAGSYVTHVTSSYKVYKRDGLYYYQDQNHIEHRANNPYDDGNGTLRETLEEDITHQPARIEITNKFGSKCTVKTVHQYLNTIRNNSNFYKRVEFSGGEITSWDRLVFDAEKNQYVGAIGYYQEFTGYLPDGNSYTDRLYHCATYYVYTDVLTGFDGNSHTVVRYTKLGNIRAIEIE